MALSAAGADGASWQILVSSTDLVDHDGIANEHDQKGEEKIHDEVNPQHDSIYMVEVYVTVFFPKLGEHEDIRDIDYSNCDSSDKHRDPNAKPRKQNTRVVRPLDANCPLNRYYHHHPYGAFLQNCRQIVYGPTCCNRFKENIDIKVVPQPFAP